MKLPVIEPQFIDPNTKPLINNERLEKMTQAKKTRVTSYASSNAPNHQSPSTQYYSGPPKNNGGQIHKNGVNISVKKERIQTLNRAVLVLYSGRKFRYVPNRTGQTQQQPMGEGHI
ncbi:hypothetical protein AYI69_g10286 [Smittium culicis]|uniref:Uncharacterized protein n=1 Tax=Smittium culicis TaxID=133412 RepID=A0A1R1X6S9_9FUNG|nr:hypothetical protein AYI69_g10286 [Smittium culicis]